MPKFEGVCCLKGDDGAPNMVRVTDGDMIFDDVDEDGYKLGMFKPPLDDLPWCSGGGTE